MNDALLQSASMLEAKFTNLKPVLVSLTRPRGRGSARTRNPLETNSLIPLRMGKIQKAATPASATSWSWSTVPPLTPMAPATSPLRISAMPPAKLTKRPWRIVSRP